MKKKVAFALCAALMLCSITLVTCVMDQPDYRWCVQAKAS